MHLLSAQNERPQEHSLGSFAGVLILSTRRALNKSANRSAQLEHLEALKKSAHMSAQQERPQSIHRERPISVLSKEECMKGLVLNMSALFSSQQGFSGGMF